MPRSKELLERSVDILMNKAEDCFDLAKAQQDAADGQHEIAARLDVSAKKLEAVGRALQAGAIEIKGEASMVAPPPRATPSK